MEKLLNQQLLMLLLLKNSLKKCNLGTAENVLMQRLIGMSFCTFSMQQNFKSSSCLLVIVVNSCDQLEPSVESV